MTTTRLSRGRGVTEHLAGVDVVLLDLGLPDVDGVDVCREIRAACDVPVIVVSARGEVNDRIQGLDCGADDYLVKPFDPVSCSPGCTRCCGAAPRRPCRATRRRRRGGRRPRGPAPPRGHRRRATGALTRKEFQILALLAAASGTVCTRGRIVAEVWGRNWPGANRTLDVHVATLRTKLGRRSWWRRCAGSATGSAPPTGRPARPRPRSRRARAAADRAGRRRPRRGRARRAARVDHRAGRPGGFFTRRLTDTVHLASLVQRPLTDAAGADLDALLDRYRQVYGVSVCVVTADGTFAPSTPAAPLDATARDRLDAALAGRRSEPPPLQMPWDGAPLVIAEPVLVDGEVRGAVVTVSPTTALHERELRTWALIAAAVWLLALGVLVSLPVVRWILPGAPARRGHRPGRQRRPRGRRGRARRRRQRAAELRGLSVSFDRMAETVTGALAAQRAFVADASHQLRNPLTALRLRLSNLNGHVDGAAADDHGAALEEAERSRSCSTGCSRWPGPSAQRRWSTSTSTPRWPTGSRPWRPSPSTRAAPGLRRPAGPDGGTGRSRGDRARRRAGQRGEVLRAGDVITVHTARRDRRVEIAVRDTGPGLAPDELERATDRFWRSPSQSNVEGSGLGLAIAARTVELAGGTLALESPDGGGLRVVARLQESAGQDTAPTADR